MESPQGLGKNEILKPPIWPIVEYDPGLQKEDVPYAVKVDAEKCGVLLHELGMSDREIRKTRIVLSRRPKNPDRGGEYDLSTRRIGYYVLTGRDIMDRVGN